MNTLGAKSKKEAKKGFSSVIKMTKPNAVKSVTKQDIPDTRSPVLENKAKELDQTAGFVQVVLKAQRKQGKAVRSLAERTDDLFSAYEAFEHHADSEELAELLQITAKFEQFHQKLLYTMLQTNTKVEENFDTWIKEEIPLARASKKQFERVRQSLDQANLKSAKTEKKSPEVEQDRELKEKQYMHQGDQTFIYINETLDRSNYHHGLQLVTHFEKYHSFFQQGFSALEQEREKVMALKALLIEQQSAEKAPTAKGLWCPDSIGGNKNRIFQVSLEEIVQARNPDGGILPFLDECLTCLEEKWLDTQGLFRISANKPKLDVIREKIDKGGSVDFYEMDDPHMITGLIKLFLRELPEPLLTFALFQDFVGTIAEEPNLPLLKATIQRLPAPNRILLHRLMKLFTAVLAKKEENLMTVNNLAIVLGPSILFEQDCDEFSMVQSIQKANKVVVAMVTHYEALFGDLFLPAPCPATEDNEREVPASPSHEASPSLSSPPPLEAPDSPLSFTQPSSSSTPPSPASDDVNPRKLFSRASKPQNNYIQAKESTGASIHGKESVSFSDEIPSEAESQVAGNASVSSWPLPRASAFRSAKEEQEEAFPPRASKFNFSHQRTGAPNSGNDDERGRFSRARPSAAVTSEGKSLSGASSTSQLRSADSNPESLSRSSRRPFPWDNKIPANSDTPAAPTNSFSPTTTPASLTSSSPTSSPVNPNSSTPRTETELPPLTCNSRGEIISSMKPPAPETLTALLRNCPPTKDYYIRLFDLFSATFSVVRAGFAIFGTSKDKYDNLTQTFNGVVSPLRAVVGIIQEYCENFPTELGVRLLKVVHEIKPVIGILIRLLRSINNSEDKQKKEELLGVIKHFVVLVYQLFYLSRSFSMMDDFNQISIRTREFAQKLLSHLRETPQNVDGTFTLLNALQNSTLSLTSLLRANIPNIQDSVDVSELSTTTVEEVEELVSQIFNEIVDLTSENENGSTDLAPNYEHTNNILHGSTDLDPNYEHVIHKINILHGMVVTATSELRPAVLSSLREHSTASEILYSTYDQLLSVLDAHNMDENPHVVNLCSELSKLRNVVNVVKTCFAPGTRGDMISSPNDWIVISTKISEILAKIIQITTHVNNLTSDTSLKPVLAAYVEHVTHIVIQFKMNAMVSTWGIKIEGYETEECVWYLNDFAFVTFPFGYTFREAASSIN
eukprot:TRINITY_DN4643_c1_g1_i3.p1 TRINITY_DN4643_c1_g1~~TRINITY_DN4643_c1_g1_i3.p1  ORF type:complete len:1190 (+),score=253.10 TRINITY_DN4643_c1_g1_i3:3-3572(+)